MKLLGWFLLVAGLIGLLIGFTMDTTVSASLSGDRVHNIGLLAARQNMIIGGGALAIIGSIVLAAGRRRQEPDPDVPLQTAVRQRSCPFCAELIRVDAVVCRFCNRELPDSLSVADNLKTLAAQGYSAKKVRDGAWDVSHPDGEGVTYVRSEEQLRVLAARARSEPRDQR